MCVQRAVVTDGEALRGVVGEMCEFGLEKGRDDGGLAGSAVFILRYLESHQRCCFLWENLVHMEVKVIRTGFYLK